MPEGDSAKADKYESQLAQAVEHLRGNVKWTLIAFGAIGTTLLAGSQLSNLGKFQWTEPRLWVALLCALVALGVAAYAVRSALVVAYTGYVELNSLTDEDIAYVERNPALLKDSAASTNCARLTRPPSPAGMRVSSQASPPSSCRAWKTGTATSTAWWTRSSPMSATIASDNRSSGRAAS